MAFIVFDKTFAPGGRIRYIQFGDAHDTLQEARKAAQFPRLRDPIILDLKRAEKIESQTTLRLRDAKGHSPVRPQGEPDRPRR